MILKKSNNINFNLSLRVHKIQLTYYTFADLWDKKQVICKIERNTHM